MFKTIQEKWNEILLFMKNEFELTDTSFNTWLKPMVLHTLIDEDLYIIASDNPAIVSIVSKKYKDLLSIAIEKVADIAVKVVFISSAEKDHIAPRRPQEDAKPAGLEDVIIKNGLNPKYTFESFVSGKSNEFAHAASLAVAEEPGQIYPLLYLYGGVGLGKTHLMHAIAIYILKNDPDARVLYTTSENFTNEYIESIRKNTTEEFRKKFRNVDLLLVDDIQFLADKAGTQEEFFNTFNTLYSQNSQIIISSDKPPKEINNLMDRIRSRFEGGMLADIEPPNFETRMAILRKKEEMDGLNIDDEVIKYIATNIKDNIRQLEGALKRIVLKSKMEKVPVNVETAARVLADVIDPKDQEKKITPQKIISVVAEHYHINEADLSSPKKNKEVAYPRQIAMYLCCDITEDTLQNIGEILKRDHATIIHGRDKINMDLQNNDALRNDIDIIKKKLSL